MHLCRFDKTDLTTNLSIQITNYRSALVECRSLRCVWCQTEAVVNHLWSLLAGEEDWGWAACCDIWIVACLRIQSHTSLLMVVVAMVLVKAGMQVCFGIDANVLLAPSLVMNGSRWVLNIIVVVQYSGLYSCRHTCTQTLSGWWVQ